MPEHFKRKPNTHCDVCNSAIYRRPCEITRKKKGFYCSQLCYGKAQRKEIPCIMCGKLILSGANKKTCSRDCANRNRIGIKYKSSGRPIKDKVRSYQSLKKRLLETRGEQCERCTFPVYQILQVHHVDRNRNNNNLKNLELLCPNCHASEHYLKKSKF